MTDRSRQPAVLLRRIERLEAQLKAEQERSERAWDGYRVALNELVDARMTIKRIREAMEGGDD